MELYREKKRDDSWSAQEENFLKENQDKPITYLSDDLGRSEDAVRNKKSRLGAVSDLEWQDEEIEFLERLYKIWDASEVAEYLGKTKDQIYNKAGADGLAETQKDYWTDHEIEFLGRAKDAWKDQRIADYLGRSLPSVRTKKSRSEVSRGYWSESDEQYIVDNFPEKTDRELAEELDRSVRAVKNRRRRKLGLIRPGMLEDTIWRPWEKLCLEIAESLYEGVEEKPELENGGIPDMRRSDVILEVKKSPFSHRVDEDVETYQRFCDRLEFWCLYGRRSFDESGVEAVSFEELKDRIRGSSLDGSEVDRFLELMERCSEGVNPYK
jgi:DNA-directed RNA polymerase specialized sigma24 family protein